MKRLFGLWLCVIFMLTVCTINFTEVNAEEEVTIIHSAGWFESAYVTWQGCSGAESYNVYSKKSDGEYVKLDNELVREYADYFRADALGLTAGEYTLKIVPVKNGSEIIEASAETDLLTVMSHIREGFAFSENSPNGTSSGAYNDDGTLRDDADVLYITNGNKDTVMINNDPTFGVGLTGILAYRQSKKISTPLAIRLIGRVEDPAGLERHTVQVQNTGNLTIEGVGDDAAIFGWLICLKRVNNVEIRNVATMYAGEGAEASSFEMDTENFNVWIHNCDFFYNAPGKDADQSKGDGAVAFKHGSSYITVSYNHMWDLGKNFVSGGPWENSNMYDERAQYFATYHHNWFDHCDARNPRCVVGSNHVYNNYYDGIAMYGIGAAMKTSVFSENNYYRNVPRPMIIASQGSDVYDSLTDTYPSKGTLSGQMGGMIKSYGDIFITPSQNWWPYGMEKDAGEFDTYIAASRDEKVPDTVHAKVGDENGFGVYNNFDTDPNIMYEYTVDTAEEAVENVKKYAGRMEGGSFEWTFNDAIDDALHGIDEGLLDKIKNYDPGLVSVGGDIPIAPPDPTPSPTPDPDATPTPSATAAPLPDLDVKAVPVGTNSYASEWFGGQSMSAGNVSADGYVGCYKGSGNSYKTNSFTAGGVTMTRGYQVKQLNSRSFYIIPESECMVTVYFYTNGTNYLGLYTTDVSEPAATFAPETGGDYSYTYHFTEVGSPLYIAGPIGDINLAGIAVSAVDTPEYEYEYEIESAEFGTNGELNVRLKYNGSEASPSARLVVAEYTDDECKILSNFKIYDIRGVETENLDYVKQDGRVKLFVWSGTDSIAPLSLSVDVQ